RSSALSGKVMPLPLGPANRPRFSASSPLSFLYFLSSQPMLGAPQLPVVGSVGFLIPPSKQSLTDHWSGSDSRVSGNAVEAPAFQAGEMKTRNLGPLGPETCWDHVWNPAVGRCGIPPLRTVQTGSTGL